VFRGRWLAGTCHGVIMRSRNPGRERAEGGQQHRSNAEIEPLQQLLGADRVKAEFQHSVDPRAFGLVKAAYTVKATLEVLSIGRTSLYAAVKQGDLHPVKFGRKTLFYASELAVFLAKLRNASHQQASPTKLDGCR
jgi:Helix-turn-helix domain